jgi:hypothetical protein
MGRVALAPHLPPAQVTAGAVTALALFASVLVHELGHAWVALRNRIPIRGITLFIFGGVAQISVVSPADRPWSFGSPSPAPPRASCWRRYSPVPGIWSAACRFWPPP